MAQVRWTPQAAADLEAAADYIARDSPRLRAAFVERVLNATERLSTFPRSGRMIPEKGDEDFREVIVQSYRVFYQLIDDVVLILAVHHGARRFGGLP